MKTKRLFVLIMVSILLVGGLSCSPSGPTVTPAPPTPQANPPPDTTPPVITEIKVERAGSDILFVLWKTDEPTVGRLEYGLPPEINLSAPWTAELSTSGGVLQTGLVFLATYFFRVRVKDAAGNETVSEDKVVTLRRWP